MKQNNRMKTGGKRFKEWIDNSDFPNRGGIFIDIYNQTYNKDKIAGTITTRINESSLYWITQVFETN